MDSYETETKTTNQTTNQTTNEIEIGPEQVLRVLRERRVSQRQFAMMVGISAGYLADLLGNRRGKQISGDLYQRIVRALHEVEARPRPHVWGACDD